MDPYLKGELWQEFHETLASAIRAQLMPRLAPKYVALLAKRYVLDRSALGVFDAPIARIMYPNVHVVASAETRERVSTGDRSGVSAPTVELPNFLEVPQAGKIADPTGTTAARRPGRRSRFGWGGGSLLRARRL
jgi:hypothetical protein